MALINQVVPRPLEFVGLALGVVGALFLTIPELVVGVLYRIVFCKKMPEEPIKFEEITQKEGELENLAQ
jgi:hypothetical protein